MCIRDRFATFAGTDGTYDSSSGNTTFTIPFTPLSEIDATYICEVGGVVQVPGADFTVAGTVLTIIGRNVTASAGGEGIAKIVLQSFGVTKSVFNFPTTGQASSSTEVPITLKGAAGGDASRLLEFKKSNNETKGAITANGVVQVRKIEQLTPEGLIVDAKTITTSDTINCGGDLTVGSAANINQSTGVATVTNLTISSGTQSTNQAVPKSYVDSFGGFEGTAIGVGTSLNTILTPGLYTGTVPANPESLVYPGNTSEGEQFALRVVRTGGTNGAHRFQEFISSSDNRISVRKFDGSSFSGWRQHAHTGDAVSSLGAATASLNMGNQLIVSLADPVGAQNAVTLNHLQTNYKNNTELLDFIGKNFGPLQVRAFAEPTGTGTGDTGAIDTGRGGFVRLSGTLNQQVNDDGTVASSQTYTGVDPFNISSGITIVNVTGTNTDPETWDNSNTQPSTGGSADTTDKPYLVKIDPGLGALSLTAYFGVFNSSGGGVSNNPGNIIYTAKLNMYTNQNCLTADKTVVETITVTSASSITAFLPNLTATRFFGLEWTSNTTNQVWQQDTFYLQVARAADNIGTNIITP